MFEAALGVNGLRNRSGIGHGRPFLPEVGRSRRVLQSERWATSRSFFSTLPVAASVVPVAIATGSWRPSDVTSRAPQFGTRDGGARVSAAP